MGEVTTAVDARRFFATDASIFTQTPALIVYPRNEQDIRKTMRFAWQLAERGRSIAVTARGAGTDQAGAAIGSGIMLVMPAHLNRIVEFDSKTGNVIVEPGINYGKLQQALITHGKFLPPYPASIDYSTIGGAVANNASGEKSVKYGDTRQFVKALRVVLANGEVIETGRLAKRELNKKLGLATFEGEIYRALDTLLEENKELVEKTKLPLSKNTAGYDLADIKQPDGSFDLTPLFVGSQGTLGIVSEITLAAAAHNPETTLLLATFDDVQKAQQAIQDLRALPDRPSAIEMVDGNLLEAVDAGNPNLLKDIVSKPFPLVALLVEFDNSNERQHKKMVKKAGKLLGNYGTLLRQETDTELQAELWKIRHAAATIMAETPGHARALPLVDDGIVPPERLAEFLQGAHDIFKRNHLRLAIWGHAGDANLHLQPHLDLSQVGDRQTAFKIIDEYYKLVVSLGGSTSGELGDGRLRAPYLESVYGSEVYALLAKVKRIFDPYDNLNPGVKINVNLADIKPLIRSDYSLGHLHQYMPRT